MTHGTENPYLPLAFKEPREDPREWRVAELSAFAWQGVVVAALFAPFQLACRLFGSWLGPTLTTSWGAQLSYGLAHCTVHTLNCGVLLFACAKLVAHRRSGLYFLAVGTGLRFGFHLLDYVFVPLIFVLNWNVFTLLYATVHRVIPMCLLIIVFVHLADRRLTLSSVLTLLTSGALSVFAMTFLIQRVAWTTGPPMWGFIVSIVTESAMLVILALFLGIGCRMSRPHITALNFTPAK